ncbi:MAG: hypothetical protein L3J79_09065 [Candidatus Marinimicrobia bacterium]|nr:hypothetical protein [Candidatus Neomarinimicrobiota bacterium]
MAAYEWRGKVLFFIMGVLSVLAAFLLTGATGVAPVGRYQMESVVRSNITHIYVIDTTTGRVKWVDDMDTTFDAMKGN